MPIPKRDYKLIHRLESYLATPRSLSQIKKRFSFPERCAYRYLVYLREAGVDVVGEKVPGQITRYYIRS